MKGMEGTEAWLWLGEAGVSSFWQLYGDWSRREGLKKGRSVRMWFHNPGERPKGGLPREKMPVG